MEKNNIAALIHYPIPIHKQKIFSYKYEDLPVVEYFVKQIVSIPLYPQLTDNEVEYIVKVINDFN